MRTNRNYAAPRLRSWISLCLCLKLSSFDSVFAFVQLYPIPLNDMSGPEAFISSWHVEGFGESGEVMNGFFSRSFSVLI